MSRVLVDLATCHQMSRKVTELRLGPLGPARDHYSELGPTGGPRATSCGAPSHAGVEPKLTDMGKHFRMF